MIVVRNTVTPAIAALFILLTTQTILAQAPLLKIHGIHAAAAEDLVALPDSSLLVLTSAALYRSTNQGGDWTLTDSGFHARMSTGLFVTPSGALLAEGPRALRSSDRGVSWAMVGPSTECFAAGVDGVLYLVSDLVASPGVGRSTDDGRTWIFGDTLPKIQSLFSFASDRLVAVADVGIYVSRDSAATWTRLPFPATGVSFWSPQRDAEGTLFVQTFDSFGPAVYRSHDGATTWIRSAEGLPEILYGIDLGARGGIMLRSPSGIYRWDGAGERWALVAPIDEPLLHSRLTAPYGDDRLFAGGEDGVRRSTDGGRTWQWATNGIEELHARRLIVAPNGDLYTKGFRILFRSTDAGATWERMPLMTWIDGLHATASGAIIATGFESIRRSTDRGLTWNEAKLSSTSLTHITSMGETIYAAAQSGDLVRSTDDGVTWRSLIGRVAGQISSMTVASNGDLYVGLLDAKVVRSTDLGMTSAHFAGPLPGAPVEIIENTNGTFFASIAGKVPIMFDELGSRTLTPGDMSDLVPQLLKRDRKLYGATRSGLHVYDLDRDDGWELIAPAHIDGTVVELVQHPGGRFLVAVMGDGIYATAAISAVAPETIGGAALSASNGASAGEIVARLTLERDVDASIALWTIGGDRVATVPTRLYSAREHTVRIATDGLASGVYVLELRSGARSVSTVCRIVR